MIRGKHAIITGANRGIGLATVELFASNHARIWACARTASEEFEAKIKELSEKYGVEITPLYFDVTDDAAVKQAIKQIASETKQMDILVNNAGKSIEKLLGMTSVRDINEIMNINYISQIRLVQIISRYMQKNHHGSIINVASVAGMRASDGGVAYGGSKAAVIFSTQTMALELAKYGIRVNSVSPGFIETDMWLNRDEKVITERLAETPLGRQGLPIEVANAILFLASDMSSYITGHNIVVDGGRNIS